MGKENGYQQLRKGRFSGAGYIYHVIFTTKSRQKIFDDFDSALRLIKILHSENVAVYAETLAFVVMPDHVHWLFELKDGSVSNAVQRVKSFFTKVYGQAVWQDGFYDHTIRTDESLVSVARYIVANPLRAGLVRSVKCYPHWDSVWLE